ncbi:hypothetical protein HY992_03010 [Candidatus Micrarchaeota archaeon]|nr:hypothetical protein [Candidatus Micrarchaeota archaeon]
MIDKSNQREKLNSGQHMVLNEKGELTAGELAGIMNLIRTNAYDVLNDLVGRGIVAYTIRNDVKYFHAAEPEKLVDYLEARKRDLDDVRDEVERMLPQIKPAQSRFDKPVIEVYEGKEGLKTILAMSVRESLKTRKEILGISVQQQKCRDLAGVCHIRWYKDREKHKIKSRYIMSAEEKTIPVKHTRFKTLPKQAKNPNEIFIFGNVTTQFFFVSGAFTAIVIKNKEITDKYRDYFEFLWKMVN